MTIKHAISAFMAEYEGTGEPNTRKKYEFLPKKLQEYGQSLGYVMIDQRTPSDVRSLRSSRGVFGLHVYGVGVPSA